MWGYIAIDLIVASDLYTVQTLFKHKGGAVVTNSIFLSVLLFKRGRKFAKIKQAGVRL